MSNPGAAPHSRPESGSIWVESRAKSQSKPATGSDTEPFEPIVRETLRQLIARYGHALYEDPHRGGAMLRNLCGQHKREVFILVSALKQRVTTDLLGRSGGLPIPLLLGRAAQAAGERAGVDRRGGALGGGRWRPGRWCLGSSTRRCRFITRCSLSISSLKNKLYCRGSGQVTRGCHPSQRWLPFLRDASSSWALPAGRAEAVVLGRPTALGADSSRSR